MKFRVLTIVVFLLLASFVSLPLGAAQRERTGSTAASLGEFFLVSSVDAKKQQIVLKRPTEVTELVRVTDKTVYLEEEGKPLQFKDLRAGDTVYVTVSSSAEGLPVALRIRKGPMTVEQLHRRYLKFE